MNQFLYVGISRVGFRKLFNHYHHPRYYNAFKLQHLKSLIKVFHMGLTFLLKKNGGFLFFILLIHYIAITNMYYCKPLKKTYGDPKIFFFLLIIHKKTKNNNEMSFLLTGKIEIMSLPQALNHKNLKIIE